MENNTNGLIQAILSKKCSSKTSAHSDALPFSEGRRNNDFISVAGHYRRKGAGEDEIKRHLLLLNATLAEPLPLEEIDHISKSICRYDVNPEDFTHDTLAKLLILKFDQHVLYVPNMAFFYYDGKTWVQDKEELYVAHLCRELVHEIFQDIEQLKMQLEDREYKRLKGAANKLKNNGFMKSSIELAKTDRSIQADFSLFLSKPTVLTFQNGALDLDTLNFRRSKKDDYALKALDFDYDPEADCPTFKRFLADTFTPEVSNLVLRIFGYAMVGAPVEQRLFIFQGHGQNGKSVLIDIAQKIFGDLSVVVQPESLNGKMDGQIRTDLVRLVGKKLMITSETKAGTVLDAALIKQITGGDKFCARELYMAAIEFKLICVPIMVTNFLPVVDGADFAISRRMCIINFEKRVEQPDRHLPDKLELEKPGILNLFLTGLRDWRQNELNVPNSVEFKTRSYVERSNLLHGFFADRLVVEEGAELSASAMNMAYHGWCSENGYKPLSANTFKEAFERHTAIQQSRNSAGRYWPCLKLR